MPWSKEDYPDSFKNLDEDVRNKAIEVANALLREGYDEGRAIPIALDTAKDYVHKNEDQPVYEVKSADDGWQLTKKGSDDVIMSEKTKEDLLDKAKHYVTEHDGELKIYKGNGELEDTLYE
ncbi:DUF2188 domain-containing protein [Planococcus lenghuensis]|uniref:DUF2188 domain-containing protein n=1 Tax=Planococcus lenghuensis TaxID=2213202 RepID=A0A1Q2KV80_9BACL|nr:DUF2188 domain-containing protein [Planococcus lenghuensis]AQQ52053.1 hypothetical protein B0X71_02225 [Planococcus lenghuensis]